MTDKNKFPKAEVKNGKLKFEHSDGFDLAIKEGIFYIKVPEYSDIREGYKYCCNFYKDKDGTLDEQYMGFKNVMFEDSVFGYTQKHDQIEQIQLELSLWNKHFPSELIKLLHQMNEIGTIVIYEIFRHVGIAEAEWEQLTGMASMNALQYCIFNHFRSEQPLSNTGCRPHKDSGFVTVLYMEESGQEIYIDETWLPVAAIPGYYTINIGESFEILTANLKTYVKAAYHRAVKKKHDRHTFGTYIGPRVDINVYQYNTNKQIEFYRPYVKIMDMQL